MTISPELPVLSFAGFVPFPHRRIRVVLKRIYSYMGGCLGIFYTFIMGALGILRGIASMIKVKQLFS
ncbi:MAG: hypothetical protein LBF87_01190 [Treponema sp.]|nr:hypothetical protein [Treponema sp.]